ncbi:Mitochondrial import inner membrane translocase subunit tim16-A, partial [Fragariocoptes setiger]
MAKIIVQIFIAGSQVVGRAFARALREELKAQKGAPSSQRPQPPPRPDEMSLDEAKRILNVDDLYPEVVGKNFRHLFEVNDKKRGGSFYLQSKIVRAKERIEKEIGTTIK